MSYTAYPLSWPLGKPRTPYPATASFKTSFADARDGLMLELNRMSAKDVVLSTNNELRRDGLPYAQRRQPADPGVAVYFTWNGHQYAFACDCWLKVEDNLQAIRKTVEAIRGISRWGTGEMMQAAFAGFKALPETATASSWWNVLGVLPTASAEEIKAAYRKQARTAHPDAGGTDALMHQLNAARDEGLAQAK